jgi:anti-sigma factor RsiW
MTREANPNQPGGCQPSPDQFSAFVDGELEPTHHDQVAAWLVAHPDDAATVEAYRRLDRAWKQTAAPEPTPAAWDAILSRLETVLPPTVTPLPQRPWMPRFVARLAAVAALLGVLWLSRPFWTPRNTQVDPDNQGGHLDRSDGEVVEEPFLLASNHDVQIITMDARDTDALIIGAPPIQGDLDLAGHNDVSLVGLLPDIRLEDWASPMIIDPLALANERDR